MSDNCSSLVEQCKTRPVWRADKGADWVGVSTKLISGSKQRQGNRLWAAGMESRGSCNS